MLMIGGQTSVINFDRGNKLEEWNGYFNMLRVKNAHAMTRIHKCN
jgi:hypothetical protein